MAKVTITIEDKEDGNISLVADFEPMVKKDEEHTTAQSAGLFAVQSIVEQSQIVSTESKAR